MLMAALMPVKLGGGSTSRIAGEPSYAPITNMPTKTFPRPGTTAYQGAPESPEKEETRE